MAFTNFDSKEINCKIVYFGPRSSGKSQNLKSVLSNASAEIKAGLLELSDPSGSNPYFDFVPISLGRVKDFHFKLHLYTLPASSLFETLHSVVLKGIDGYVFVADSRIESMADNASSLNETRRLLMAEGFNIAELPYVIQYNKRDVKDPMPVHLLRQELNPSAAPDHEAIALRSIGTLETVQTMAKLVLRKLIPT